MKYVRAISTHADPIYVHFQILYAQNTHVRMHNAHKLISFIWIRFQKKHLEVLGQIKGEIAKQCYAESMMW